MAKQQGTVGIPGDYFLKMAKHDYNDYQTALAREFYQNSIDAGATRITVDVDHSERSITISDNGCGMSKDILLDKLLVLGGSHKGAGSVGAFGKAKELLFFSWKRYSIRTNKWLVTGSGGDYIIASKTGHHTGTKVVVWIQDEESLDRLEADFADVAALTQTKSKILVNGRQIECQLKRGRKINDYGWTTLHVNKSRQLLYVHVRIDGMWMFKWYVGDINAEVVLELSHSSLDCLTSNRDGFKSKYRSQAEAFIREIMVDKRKVLKRQPEYVVDKIKGTGAVEVKPPAEQNERMGRAMAGGSLDLDDFLTDAVIAAVDNGVDGDIAETRFVQMVKHREFTGDVVEYEDRIKFIGYKPDFVIKRYDNKQGEADRFMTRKRAALIANMWTEVVKQVMLDNEIYERFYAGFIFDPEVEAQFQTDGNGRVTIYINPKSVLKTWGLEKKVMSNKQMLMEDLKDKAIHELTHHKRTPHDEDFILHMAHIRSRTFASDKSYDRIAKIK